MLRPGYWRFALPALCSLGDPAFSAFRRKSANARYRESSLAGWLPSVAAAMLPPLGRIKQFPLCHARCFLSLCPVRSWLVITKVVNWATRFGACKHGTFWGRRRAGALIFFYVGTIRYATYVDNRPRLLTQGDQVPRKKESIALEACQAAAVVSALPNKVLSSYKLPLWHIDNNSFRMFRDEIQNRRGVGTGESVDFLAVLEEQDSRHGPDAELLGQFG